MTSERARRQRREELRVAALDRAALKAVLGTKDGRWFLMRLLDECRVFERTMTGNSWTYFNEGGRDVGLRLRGRIIRDGHVELLQLAEREYIRQAEKVKEGQADGRIGE